MSRSLPSLYTKHQFFLNVIYRRKVIYQNMWYSDHVGSSIDSFTENLVLERGLKWKNFLNLHEPQKSLLKITRIKFKDKPLNILMNDNKEKELLFDNIVDCVKANNISQIIVNLDVCQRKNYCPSTKQLLFLAEVFVMHKNYHGITILQNLCKFNHPKEYKSQSCYNHIVAKILWAEGNVKDSLNLFGSVYCDNILLRKQMGIIIYNCFLEIITNHGEAARIIAIDFVKTIVNKHNDYNLIGYLWKVFFESEWFSDNLLSNKLLVENNQLKQVIVWMLPNMARQLLQEHKMDTYYRLIEVLLTNDMKQQCGPILRLLFDYKYVVGDLQGCSSIVKACYDLELTLTERQEKKFVCLLLKTDPNINKTKVFELKF